MQGGDMAKVVLSLRLKDAVTGTSGADLRVPLVIGLLLSGCLNLPESSLQQTPVKAHLVVRCNVPEASLWINERYVGEVGEFPRGFRLPPQRVLVEVRMDDHTTRYADLRLTPNDSQVIDFVLFPLSPDSSLDSHPSFNEG